MKAGQSNFEIGTKIRIKNLKGEDNVLSNLTGTITNPFAFGCTKPGWVGIYLDSIPFKFNYYYDNKCNLSPNDFDVIPNITTIVGYDYNSIPFEIDIENIESFKLYNSKINRKDGCFKKYLIQYRVQTKKSIGSESLYNVDFFITKSTFNDLILFFGNEKLEIEKTKIENVKYDSKKRFVGDRIAYNKTYKIK